MKEIRQKNHKTDRPQDASNPLWSSLEMADTKLMQTVQYLKILAVMELG